eukprot:335369_1
MPTYNPSNVPTNDPTSNLTHDPTYSPTSNPAYSPTSNSSKRYISSTSTLSPSYLQSNKPIATQQTFLPDDSTPKSETFNTLESSTIIVTILIILVVLLFVVIVFIAFKLNNNNQNAGFEKVRREELQMELQRVKQQNVELMKNTTENERENQKGELRETDYFDR